MPFQSMKRIIPGTLKRLGIDATVSATRVLEESKTALMRLWGEDRATCAEMVSFANGELVVRVTTSSALDPLQRITVPWMNEINRALGERHVLRIRSEEGRR
jgi:hypothetical protein